MSRARSRQVGAMVVLVTFATHEAEAMAALPDPPVPPPFHQLGLTANLLAPLSSTYQISAEWMITARDSVTFAPWFAIGHAEGQQDALKFFNYSPEYSVDFAGQGIDAQYRHYFGDWYGGNGPFLAPGFDMALFQVNGKGCKYIDEEYHPMPCVNDARQSFSYIGPTADVGIQAALAWGLTFGGSIGVRYRLVAGDLDSTILPSTFDTAHGPGFGARVRIWVGWSFL